MKCDLCSKPASVHVCEIHDGKKIERHLCAEHGQQAGIHDPAALASGQMMVNGVICSLPQEAAVRGILDNLRGTRNFLRQHGRMPRSVKDLKEGMSSPDEGSSAQIKDAELLRELRRMDGMVRFIQTHGRMPSTKKEFKSVGYE